MVHWLGDFIYMKLSKYSSFFLVLPAVAFVLLFSFLPAALAVINSFRNSMGSFTLNNYKLLPSFGIYKAIEDTLIISIGAIFFQLFLALIASSLLLKISRGRSIIMALILIPMSIATVVSAILFTFVFEYPGGIANEFLGSMHIGLQNWLSPTSFLVYFSIIFADSWKTTPIMILILYSGMLRVPQELYYAASVDGAGPIRRFFSITIPNIRSFIAVSLLIRGISEFNIFALPLILVGYNPPFLTTLTYELFSSGISIYLSYATATVLLAIVSVFIFIVLKIGGGRR